ncbi:MAG: AAA family ATPase [Candidatus Moraniibacteriota bacterium]|jgi:dephospho-CoA kinase
MKIILGIAGEIGSGKGMIARHIKEKYKGSYHQFSAVLRDVANRMHLEESRENLQKISSIFRQNFNEDILSIVVCKDVEMDTHQIVAIDGVRRMADIKCLKNLEGFKLIYVEANIDIRYHRIVDRRENTDDAHKPYSEFVADHQREAESQIADLKNYADFVISNEGTFLELYHQIDEIISGLNK